VLKKLLFYKRFDIVFNVYPPPPPPSFSFPFILLLSPCTCCPDPHQLVSFAVLFATNFNSCVDTSLSKSQIPWISIRQISSSTIQSKDAGVIEIVTIDGLLLQLVFPGLVGQRTFSAFQEFTHVLETRSRPSDFAHSFAAQNQEQSWAPIDLPADLMPPDSWV
jgi:hypothetical protein